MGSTKEVRGNVNQILNKDLIESIKNEVIKSLKQSGHIKESAWKRFKLGGLHGTTIIAVCAFYGMIHFSIQPVREDISNLKTGQDQLKTGQTKLETELKNIKELVQTALSQNRNP